MPLDTYLVRLNVYKIHEINEVFFFKENVCIVTNTVGHDPGEPRSGTICFGLSNLS